MSSFMREQCANSIRICFHFLFRRLHRRNLVMSPKPLCHKSSAMDLKKKSLHIYLLIIEYQAKKIETSRTQKISIFISH